MTGFLEFDERQANYIAGIHGRWFLYRSSGGAKYILPDSCPHRGGPLHLARREGGVLRCPWHGMRWKEAALIRHALPSVRAGALWLVALPASGWAVALKRGGEG